jgi:hypothetical protein
VAQPTRELTTTSYKFLLHEVVVNDFASAEFKAVMGDYNLVRFTTLLAFMRWLVVNSTLGQFIASVQTVTARFPFDSEGTREDRGGAPTEDRWVRAERLENERVQAAEDLVTSLRRIDPASVADLDGFWMAFVADVQMGNYAVR